MTYINDFIKIYGPLELWPKVNELYNVYYKRGWRLEEITQKEVLKKNSIILSEEEIMNIIDKTLNEIPGIELTKYITELDGIPFHILEKIVNDALNMGRDDFLKMQSSNAIKH